jgi:hypothetical protein
VERFGRRRDKMLGDERPNGLQTVNRSGFGGGSDSTEDVDHASAEGGICRSCRSGLVGRGGPGARGRVVVERGVSADRARVRVNPETLRTWVTQADIDGLRPHLGRDVFHRVRHRRLLPPDCRLAYPQRDADRAAPWPTPSTLVRRFEAAPLSRRRPGSAPAARVGQRSRCQQSSD